MQVIMELCAALKGDVVLMAIESQTFFLFTVE